MQTTAARAVTPTTTITQTAITSPSDPSYFYDPTAGAYGGITVTGTTDSTDPSSDQVDIDCYTDDGSQQDPTASVGTLVSGVSLNSSGGFSTTVPYSAYEEFAYNGVCRLRAVPAGSDPITGLSSFAGPRTMLASIQPVYSPGSGSQLYHYQFTAPQLGAVNYFAAAGGEWGCGMDMSLASTQYFGDTGDGSFGCADWFNGPNSELGALQVDGQNAQTAWDGPAAITVSATQDPANGDITIHETEPLYTWDCSGGCSFVSEGVQDDRTIQQAASGKVVMITDDFVSTDGAGHVVTYDVSAFVNDGIYRTPTSANLFELPGQAGYSQYASGDTVAVGAGAPATVYSYNDIYSDGSTDGFGAITYFQAPSGPVSFFDANTPVIPFTLVVPAGGSQAMSLQYSSEYSQSALAGDLQTGLDLYTGPSIGISSPSAGSTVATATVTVSGSVSAASGIRSVSVNGVDAAINGSSFSASVPLDSGSNVITAVLTTNGGVTASTTETVTYTPASLAPGLKKKWAGARWLPIANTGTARHSRGLREKLTGSITAGSAAVKYYFQYGLHGRYSHRSRVMRLGAGKRMRHVALTVSGLTRGDVYQYRLVASGKYGHSAGRMRSFRAAKA